MTFWRWFYNAAWRVGYAQGQYDARHQHSCRFCDVRFISLEASQEHLWAEHADERYG